MIKHIENVPIIENAKELEPYIQQLYIIEPYMLDRDVYEEFFESIYDVLKGCFHKKDCREYTIKFKFYNSDAEIHEMQFRHFVINLMLWLPFVSIGTVKFMDSSIIMDGFKIIEDPEYDLERFIDYKIIDTLRRYNVKGQTVNKLISAMLYNLRRISVDFSDIMNLNFSFFTIYEEFKKNPRIREIMECRFPDQSVPRDIEVQIDSYMDEFIGILKKSETNPIGVILRSRTGMKDKQVAEFFIAQAYKPTIDGQVMTVPIQNSTLIGGLDRPSYIYIDASAARKSLIMNKTVMGKAGNFGKLVIQLVRTVELSKEVTDCNTKHFVPIEIKSKGYLKKLNGRFYRTGPDDEFKVINSETDKHLVGKVLEFRSPATCALGNCICQKCYGRNAAINYELASGLMAFESEEVTKELNQNILSSKHLLTTKSEILKFNEVFYKYFTLDAGDVYPETENNNSVQDPTRVALWMDPASIEKVSDLDSDSSYNTYISSGKFYVVNLDSGEKEEIIMENEKEIFLSDAFIKIWASKKRKDGLVLFSELDDSSSIFEINILNDELTKPLYEMMKLFNNSKSGSKGIAVMVQRFIDLLMESGIKASSVAGECIINRLIRSKTNIYERPDFTCDEMGAYMIKTVAYCLEHNASPTLGLSTQYLKRQLLNDAIVTERTGTSYMDPFMKIVVPNLYSIYGVNKDKFRVDS